MDVIIVVIKMKLNEKKEKSSRDSRWILHEAIKFNCEKSQAQLRASSKLIIL